MIVRLGIPRHYRPDPQHYTTACGQVLPAERSTENPREVDCLRCRRTRKWHQAYRQDRDRGTESK